MKVQQLLDNITLDLQLPKMHWLVQNMAWHANLKGTNMN